MGVAVFFHPQGFDFYCWKEIALRWCYMQVLLRKGGPTTVWQFILWYQCQFWWEDMTDSAENWLSALISLLRNNHEEMFTTLWFLFVIWWIAFCYLYSLLNYVVNLPPSKKYRNASLHSNLFIFSCSTTDFETLWPIFAIVRNNARVSFYAAAVGAIIPRPGGCA